MIKFIGKLIKWIVIAVIGLVFIGYLVSDDKEDCNSKDDVLIRALAKTEVEKLAKYEIVSSSGGYVTTEIVKNDTIKAVSVTLKAKNGFNATTTNSFDVKYLVRGCDLFLYDVKKW